jgi:hypothetical protein
METPVGRIPTGEEIMKESERMDGVKDTPVARKTKTNWIEYVLVVLVVEKIIQHTAVTLAFYLNWKDIRSTVAISPDLLMVSGAVVAILFALSL